VVARDLTDVRALQEDENERYKRLTEAVVAGWVLPNEARSEIGLPPIEDVMPEPQAVNAGEGEPPVQLPVSAMRRLMAMKQSGNFDAYPELMAQMIELAMPAFDADLNGYFDGQRRRIKSRVMGA
jgi:hypothetical protein